MERCKKMDVVQKEILEILKKHNASLKARNIPVAGNDIEPVIELHKDGCPPVVLDMCDSI